VLRTAARRSEAALLKLPLAEDTFPFLSTIFGMPLFPGMTAVIRGFPAGEAARQLILWPTRQPFPA
jgi:hypothetical protein